jgi:hypothetical protein
MQEEMKVQLLPEIDQLVGKAVVVTGAARSGTTVMGSLIHTLDRVEYLFEPPMLYGLFSVIDQMDPDLWRFLYANYLFEDFLMDALAGRRMNLNQHDDSSIYKAKLDADIANRLESQYRRADLFSQTSGRRIAYKAPDILPYVSHLQLYYPQTRVIIMFREPEAVVDSIRTKGWFGPRMRLSAVLQGPWRSLSPDVPFWVPEQAVDRWLGASEIERCYLYYLWMYESIFSLEPESYCLVDYNQFVADPEWQFGRVFKYLGAHPTSKTTEVLSGVRRIDQIPQETMSSVSTDIQHRVHALFDEVDDLMPLWTNI